MAILYVINKKKENITVQKKRHTLAFRYPSFQLWIKKYPFPGELPATSYQHKSPWDGSGVTGYSQKSPLGRVTGYQVPKKSLSGKSYRLPLTSYQKNPLWEELPVTKNIPLWEGLPVTKKIPLPSGGVTGVKKSPSGKSYRLPVTKKIPFRGELPVTKKSPSGRSYRLLFFDIKAHFQLTKHFIKVILFVLGIVTVLYE